MYWTDWGTNPHIACAGLDGSRQKILIHSSTLQWPNGLTIDYAMDRLYWTDAKMNQIGSSNLLGGDTMVILHSQNYLKHPFAITLFEVYN